MSRTIQIRNVPDGVHRILMSRAALAGLSLADYILKELEAMVSRPTMEELRARLSQRSAVTLLTPVEAALRGERDGR